MPRGPAVMSLEDVATALYCAIDDALAQVGIVAQNGKLIPRRGPAPEVDDREVLCMATLKDLVGFESDHAYCAWLKNEKTLRSLFPRQLSRQNFAERRALLTPLILRLNGALCELAGEGDPPFLSSTRTPLMSVVRSGHARDSNASTGFPEPATVPL